MFATLLPTVPCDPAAMAEEVRTLAAHARLTLRKPTLSPSESRALLRRITRLQRQLRVSRSSDLAEWLESLRQRVTARLAG
jgi:hypothetical protein